jgi:hypothetical protein
MTALKRAGPLESLALIATVALLSSWGMRPFVAQALAPMGPVAQHSAEAALWLSAVAAPFAALVKAAAAALVCWAASILLNERLSLVKLISIFCVAEALFCVRDLGLLGLLSLRGLAAIHSTSDLIVPFGAAFFIHARSAPWRIAVSSWDIFHLAWAVLLYFLLKESFKLPKRSAACLALTALALRVLFAAATMLYTA